MLPAAGPCELGCPDTRVYLMDQGGGRTLADLTEFASFVKYARELDDDSEFELTLHVSGGATGDACCDVLSNMSTWKHELAVVRGDETVWGPGPVVTISVQREIAHIVARDVTAWLDVRLVHQDYNLDMVDLTDIARKIIVDALTLGPAASMPPGLRDVGILDLAQFYPSGKMGSIQVVAKQRTAGEILRELATGHGLDFTVLNRSLIVGADFAFGPVGPLRDEDFLVDLEVTEHGLAAGTYQHITGADNMVSEAGGADPYYGLIERATEGVTSAVSQTCLDRMAREKVAITNPPPVTVNVPSGAGLAPTAPVCANTLVPGTLVDLEIQELCRPAYARQRLTAVEFRLDENGEQVGITIAPQGAVELAVETA